MERDLSPPNAAAVRASVTERLTSLGVSTGQIADILVEGDSVCIVLSAAVPSPSLVVSSVSAPPPDLARKVHAAVAEVIPTARIEVRVDQLIYRGGAGFGTGRHVIAILGGKGGVGKSTVAVNLALTLSAMGVKVGLLDADINAPDVPHLLGVAVTEPAVRSAAAAAQRQIPPRSLWQEPLRRYGIEVMSVGLVVPERFAPRITSRLLVSTLLRNLVFQVAWTAEILIIDAPPGTGEELQVIARELPLSGALFVTTPQDLAQMDAERTLALINEHAVPIIGLVKNMCSMTCPHCDQRIDMFAGSARLTDAGLRVLGEIPFDLRFSSANPGRPLVLDDPRGPIALQFAKIAHAARRWLANYEAEEMWRAPNAMS